MATIPDILLIQSTIQATDETRRQVLAERFNFLYYDCESTEQFKERMQPGGPYANIVAIVRNGWLKAGPLAYQVPFAANVVAHYPPSLKLICCSGHGYDTADIEAITAKGIWYCNTPNACTEAVANTTLSLVLDSFRFLTYAQWCARFDWMKSRDLGMQAVDPSYKSLGVVGFGDIGLAVARKCEAAFNMKIHYHGPRRKRESEKSLLQGATYWSELNDMIPHVDCIVLAAPYTQDTHHLLSTKQFSLAKKEGIRVVNIARGNMVDEDALLQALEHGTVVGAGLDVHANEPGINPKLKDNWRVTVLPHIGVCSWTSWENFEQMNLDNLEAFFNTGKPLTPVNNITEDTKLESNTAFEIRDLLAGIVRNIMPFFLVIGAGVVGLTTALELRARYPSAAIVVAAKYLPGDSAKDYTSAWGGANWFPASRDNGPQEDWEAITYRKFKELSLNRPETGIRPMPIRWHYERPIDEVGIKTPATGKLWFEELVGGLKKIEKMDLPTGCDFGFEMASFVIDVQKYLPWLQTEATTLGIEVHRRVFRHIKDAFRSYPQVTAIFNCTGIGALTLGGVEDQNIFAARGQILLVEGPEEPIRKMAFRAPHRDGEATHIFPRGEHGGVILGGCRQKDNWDGEADMEFAEVIKKRCCALVPELGNPKDLKIIKHGVGLRPGRKGGSRVAVESIEDRLVIHNYGAGGTGFQASWGLAKYAVDLLPAEARL
ncbi:hypothetical protein S7711_08415 [Stachybotrys chartarum IBT 7711]|uniref:FAD dependent oxidoreductase domain-containing protein n=1 Tax=Stachybotrys chartarum (strain CBS 109288 / IBT 7711) TaxID=1280523 RepID=A0A084BAR9_STACB|nr:hypothetical protein S7711_08415 [Stachybotrys chartarum IBT 7711]KFA50458.1 hypothetical protein S40293_07896 [Stachybotrys chartarum IBT 40293]